mmetsp:Transcript_9793/g.15042  ORF Transcript_9793/g.15042 Transcript_9793/m.15042 type:complete len:319 (+) Transcript_9793:92-1048(+)
MMRSMIQWISQEGRSASKHHEWTHPCVVFILHYSIVFVVITWFHDTIILPWALSSSSSQELSSSTTECIAESHQYEQQQTIAMYMILYGIVQFSTRLLTQNDHYRHCVLYEYTWMCNSTIMIGSLSLYLGRPLIASAHCISIGIDQILWYVDLLGWTISGFRNFPVGVMKYLTWPETPNIAKVTSTHHLWTIPVLLYATRGLHPLAFPLAMVITTVNVCLSRWMTPPAVKIEKGRTQETIVAHTSKLQPPAVKYLNVNLSHEVWKDIAHFIYIDDKSTTLVYLFHLLWRWQGFNFIVYKFLSSVSSQIFGDDVAPPVC